MAIPVQINRRKRFQLSKLGIKPPTFSLNALSFIISVVALLFAGVSVYYQFLRVNHDLTASVLGWERNMDGHVLATVAFINRGNQSEVIGFACIGLSTDEKSSFGSIVQQRPDSLFTGSPETIIAVEPGRIVVRRFESLFSEADLKLVNKARSDPFRPNLVLVCTVIDKNRFMDLKTNYFGGLVYDPDGKTLNRVSVSAASKIQLIK